MEFSKFLSNLRYIGTSPYAFTSYICLTAAWVYVTISRYWLSTVAKIMKDLPPQDRVQVIQREYNTTPRAGLSAEQWIRSRQQTLLLVAFLSLVISVTIIMVIALGLTASESIKVDKANAAVVLIGKCLPDEFIHRYWAKVNQGDFETAWTSLSPEFQHRAHYSDFSHYREGFRNLELCSVSTTKVESRTQDIGTALIDVDLVFKKGKECLEEEKGSFEFYLVKDTNTEAWLIQRVVSADEGTYSVEVSDY